MPGTSSLRALSGLLSATNVLISGQVADAGTWEKLKAGLLISSRNEVLKVLRTVLQASTSAAGLPSPAGAGEKAHHSANVLSWAVCDAVPQARRVLVEDGLLSGLLSSHPSLRSELLRGDVAPHSLASVFCTLARDHARSLPALQTQLAIAIGAGHASVIERGACDRSLWLAALAALEKHEDDEGDGGEVSSTQPPALFEKPAKRRRLTAECDVEAVSGASCATCARVKAVERLSTLAFSTTDAAVDRNTGTSSVDLAPAERACFGLVVRCKEALQQAGAALALCASSAGPSQAAAGDGDDDDDWEDVGQGSAAPEPRKDSSVAAISIANPAMEPLLDSCKLISRKLLPAVDRLASSLIPEPAVHGSSCPGCAAPAISASSSSADAGVHSKELSSLALSMRTILERAAPLLPSSELDITTTAASASSSSSSSSLSSTASSSVPALIDAYLDAAVAAAGKEDASRTRAADADPKALADAAAAEAARVGLQRALEWQRKRLQQGSTSSSSSADAPAAGAEGAKDGPEAERKGKQGKKPKGKKTAGGEETEDGDAPVTSSSSSSAASKPPKAEKDPLAKFTGTERLRHAMRGRGRGGGGRR